MLKLLLLFVCAVLVIFGLIKLEIALFKFLLAIGIIGFVLVLAYM